MRNVELDERDKYAIITIDNPPMNVLSTEILETLRELLEKLRKGKSRALIITGAGEKAFVAGADIKEMKDKNPAQAHEFSELGQNVLNDIENLPKPIIAAVNGYALGGGMELVLACDLIIASKNAKFGQPEVSLGVMPGFGGTQRLPRRVGNAKGKELIFTGEIIDVDEAYRIGLVNKVTKRDELMDEAIRMAETIASRGPLAVGLAKSAINKGLDMSLKNGLALEAKSFAICFTTKDKKEGMNAFLAKRKPKFKGE